MVDIPPLFPCSNGSPAVAGFHEQATVPPSLSSLPLPLASVAVSQVANVTVISEAVLHGPRCLHAASSKYRGGLHFDPRCLEDACQFAAIIVVFAVVPHAPLTLGSCMIAGWYHSGPPNSIHCISKDCVVLSLEFTKKSFVQVGNFVQVGDLCRWVICASGGLCRWVICAGL